MVDSRTALCEIFALHRWFVSVSWERLGNSLSVYISLPAKGNETNKLELTNRRMKAKNIWHTYIQYACNIVGSRRKRPSRGHSPWCALSARAMPAADACHSPGSIQAKVWPIWNCNFQLPHTEKDEIWNQSSILFLNQMIVLAQIPIFLRILQHLSAFNFVYRRKGYWLLSRHTTLGRKMSICSGMRCIG